MNFKDFAMMATYAAYCVYCAIVPIEGHRIGGNWYYLTTEDETTSD